MAGQDCIYVHRRLRHEPLKAMGHFEVPEGYDFKAFVKIENGVVTFIACRAEDPGN